MQSNLYQSYITDDNRFVKVIGFVGNKCKIRLIDNDDKYIDDKIDIIDEKKLVQHCIIHDITHAFINNSKYVSIPYTLYQTLKPLLMFLTNNFEHYINCEIYRKKNTQNNTNFVVFALKDERFVKDKKKSDTKGFAKKQLLKTPKIKCCFCNCQLTTNNATTEHIIPFSQCYNNSSANFCVTCKDCNDERGVQDFYTFLTFKKKRFLKLNFPGLKIKKVKIFI